jgi:hypothetical protein
MDKYLEDWAIALRDGNCTIGEYDAYASGKKEIEKEVERLKTILLELSEINNLSQWYDFDSISITQMQLRQWIKGKLNE